jgi:V/A-type H+/Na+-transporting ATPase subunit C
VSSDYGYINARVRGMKARLLGPEFYSSALDASDFRAFMSTLSQSPYMRDLEEAQARYEGLKALDEALARNFYGMTRSLLTFSDGEPQQLIALLLLRYDLANLKSIARAKHAGRDLGDVQDVLFPAGSLKLPVLEAVAAAPAMAGAAQLLPARATPLKAAFLRAAQQYQADGDLYALELALDRAYFATVFETLERVSAPPEFVDYLRREADATNLRTAMKLRGQAVDPAALFIPGGKFIKRQTFEAILQDPSPSALQALSGTPFAGVADAATLSEAESAIREAQTRLTKRLAQDPLDIGVVAHFLRLKEEETARLRLLARAKFYGVPRETLQRELGHAYDAGADRQRDRHRLPAGGRRGARGHARERPEGAGRDHRQRRLRARRRGRGAARRPHPRLGARHARPRVARHPADAQPGRGVRGGRRRHRLHEGAGAERHWLRHQARVSGRRVPRPA